jgi:hypothetical protein
MFDIRVRISESVNCKVGICISTGHHGQLLFGRLCCGCKLSQGFLF